MVCFFNFLAQYSAFQGLGFRIQMAYPGNWAAAQFAGAIATNQGAVVGGWQFSTVTYDAAADASQIDFYLSPEAAAALPVSLSGHSYDVLARLPQQDPTILLKGKIAVLDLQTDPATLALPDGAAAGASITPTVALKVSQFNQAIVLGVAGFSSALIDAAIAAHNADPAAHGGINTGGDGLIYSAPAGGSLSPLRVVCAGDGGAFDYADCNTPNHGGLPLWFLYAAADQGATALGHGAGIFTDSSWAWAAGPIWLGENGTLTQAAPMAGAFLRIVAEPITPQTLSFKPSEATYL